MRTCVICRRPCIPLADYDVPTCVGCDSAMEMVTRIATFSDVPRQPCGTHAAFNRHKRRGEVVDVLCAAAERAYHQAHHRRTYQPKRGVA